MPKKKEVKKAIKKSAKKTMAAVKKVEAHPTKPKKPTILPKIDTEADEEVYNDEPINDEPINKPVDLLGGCISGVTLKPMAYVTLSGGDIVALYNAKLVSKLDVRYLLALPNEPEIQINNDVKDTDSEEEENYIEQTEKDYDVENVDTATEDKTEEGKILTAVNGFLIEQVGNHYQIKDSTSGNWIQTEDRTTARFSNYADAVQAATTLDEEQQTKDQIA